MLFKQQHFILALTQKQLCLYAVTPASADQEIEKIVAYDCAVQTAPQALEKILTKLITLPRSLRLLLADEYAYITDVSIPSKLSPEEERLAVQEAAQVLIPEELATVVWDYKIKEVHAQTATATVLVPVVRAYKPLEEAITQAGIILEAVEATQLALERHENPVIGIALKADITGKDAIVLNLQAQPEPESSFSKETPAHQRLWSRSFAVLLLTTLLLTIAIVYILGTYPNSYL